MRLTADTSSNLVANTDTISQTGKAIQTNAVNLNQDLMRYLSPFEG